MTGRLNHHFQTTQWTVIAQSLGTDAAAKDALAELCQQYYRPVEFFIERWLRNRLEQESRTLGWDSTDLTQSYFAKLLSSQQLMQANPLKGRFRNYLLASVKNFLIDHELQRASLARGGGQSTRSLSQASFNNNYEANEQDPACVSMGIGDPSAFPPESFFDREWAIAIVERSIQEVQDEFLAGSKEKRDVERFKMLQSAIITPYIDEVAKSRWDELEWSENAFRVALHRIRKRFRFFVQRRIASTLSDASELDAEVDYLILALTAR